MKKIKSIKWSVELSYKDTFVFMSLTDAAVFIDTAVRNAEDPEDVISFRLVPYVEYEEEPDKEVIDDKEVIENEDVPQD